MPVCDGATCSREIPWRMTVSALQMRAGNVPFSVDAIYAALRAELVAAGCWNISPNKRAVVFRSFCKTCWDRQAAVWGDVGTYAAARAKTVPEAIFMQVGCPDYQVNGAYDKQAIISCAVHELMHYWSVRGNGPSGVRPASERGLGRGRCRCPRLPGVQARLQRRCRLRELRHALQDLLQRVDPRRRRLRQRVRPSLARGTGPRAPAAGDCHVHRRRQGQARGAACFGQRRGQAADGQRSWANTCSPGSSTDRIPRLRTATRS